MGANASSPVDANAGVPVDENDSATTKPFHLHAMERIFLGTDQDVPDTSDASEMDIGCDKIKHTIGRVFDSTDPNAEPSECHEFLYADKEFKSCYLCQQDIRDDVEIYGNEGVQDVMISVEPLWLDDCYDNKLLFQEVNCLLEGEDQRCQPIASAYLGWRITEPYPSTEHPFVHFVREE